VGRLHKRIPIFNLAAGSCYPWERQPATVDNRGDAEFLTAIHGYCRLTTVRDRLSHHLFGTLGFSVPHIPCSALLAADLPEKTSNGDGSILINYMPGGGHYDFGQGVDGSSWEQTMRNLVARLRKRHRVAFICHSEKELAAASSVADGLPCYLPKSVEEYFAMASEAKAGVFNRMHASVGLAGMGIPSIAIGTDTRLLMVEHIGLPSLYIKEAGLETLEEKLEGLLRNREEEKDRLLGLREQTMRSYVEAVSHAWS
jgi:polysaccharide pyruvyl transferase WcaK-like protein